jgi:hypothetical protein
LKGHTVYEAEMATMSPATSHKTSPKTKQYLLKRKTLASLEAESGAAIASIKNPNTAMSAAKYHTGTSELEQSMLGMFEQKPCQENTPTRPVAGNIAKMVNIAICEKESVFDSIKLSGCSNQFRIL